MATKASTPLVGNGSGQILLGRVACDRVIAADEIERADKTALTAAIAQAAQKSRLDDGLINHSAASVRAKLRIPNLFGLSSRGSC
jgi:hypothetical protein